MIVGEADEVGRPGDVARGAEDEDEDRGGEDIIGSCKVYDDMRPWRSRVLLSTEKASLASTLAFTGSRPQA